ncbi:hypothetical protein LTR37_003854 [Vermiconidia calcicola]|uniref:Uncharacterized protein n=1 Tax=Vermiconidia calcicola TaxID=1690605 RepID=A0ACC3NQQ0_9PEZI|nr:hypothetical protein LTR37_003854 [Vermiconidia calcicola]
MPLVLSRMLEEDIPAFAVMDEECMQGWGFARAMQHLNPDQPRREFIEEWTREDWGKDESQHWLKVSDTETNELIAVALWRFPIEGLEPHIEPPPSGKAEGSESKTEETKKQAPSVPDLFTVSRREWKILETEFIGDKPYAVLGVLATHPKHQRRGAGSMLVKWGCDKADKLGMITALQASTAGQAVYTKHGFEIKRAVELDLRPWGVDETELRRGMVRQPR